MLNLSRFENIIENRRSEISDARSIDFKFQGQTLKRLEKLRKN